MKKIPNKFAKFATFVSLTARDAFSTRPLQRRHEELVLIKEKIV